MVSTSISVEKSSAEHEMELGVEIDTIMPAGNYRNIPSAENDTQKFRERNFAHADIFGVMESKAFAETFRKDKSISFIPRSNPLTPRSRRLVELSSDKTCFPVERDISMLPVATNVVEDVSYPLNMMLESREKQGNSSNTDTELEAPKEKEAQVSQKLKIAEENDTGEVARMRRILQDRSRIFGEDSEFVSSAYEKCVSLLQAKGSHESDCKKPAKPRHPMYSELFGRSTPDWHRDCHAESDINNLMQEKPEKKDEIGSSQDRCSSSAENLTAHERYVSEFKSHLPLPFGVSLAPTTSNANQIQEDDNSIKLKEVALQGPKEIHQAHLQSTLLGPEFYSKAKLVQPSETVQIQLNGLHSNITEADLILYIRRCGCHLAQLRLDLDPLSHTCKGRAELLLRTNDGERGIKRFGESLAADFIGVTIVDIWNKNRGIGLKA